MKFRKHAHRLLSLVSAGVLTLSLTGCSYTPGNASATRTGIYFDTVISVTLYGSDSKMDQYFDGCFRLARHYEDLLSTKIPDSDISRINANPNTPVKVNPDTLKVIKDGLKYSRSSGGSFDITIGKLTDLWNISQSSADDHRGKVPDDASIQALLPSINYESVKVDGDAVTLTDPNCAIDLGGIAKGFIADQMKEYLIKEGVKSCLINLGGNVLTIGSKPDGKAFTIGIQKPFDQDGSSIAAIRLDGQTAVTSGTYQRYFESDGKIYHHILNTNTGYPEQNGLSSVTIITDKSVDGDALSTTVFLMGLNQGMKYIESHDGVEAIFITDDGKVKTSSGIGKKIPFELVGNDS